MIRLMIVSLLFSLSVAPTAAQDSFTIEHFGAQEGLPSNGIKGLQFDDKTGFLWLATESGIVRYNGLELKKFNPEDEKKLAAGRILFLVKNNAGDIYSATGNGYMFKIDRYKPLFYDSVVIRLRELNKMFTVNISERLFRHDINPEKNFTVTILYEKVFPVGDTACLFIRYDTLYFFSVHLTQPVAIPLPLHISDAFMIGNQYFFKDEQQRILHFNIATHQLTVMQADEFTGKKGDLFFWENGMKNPIVINGKMAWKLDYTGGKIMRRQICDSIPVDFRIRFVQYNETLQTIFLGSDSKGFYVVRKNKVASVRVPVKKANQRESYYAQLALPNGNILTNEGDIIGNNLSRDTDLPIQGTFGSFLYRDGDSLVWYAKKIDQSRFVYLHSYRFATKQATVYHKAHISFSAVMTKSGGSLYIADTSGILKLQSDTLMLQDNRIRFSNAGGPFVLQETKPGVLLATYCKTLFSYNTRTHESSVIYNTSESCIRSTWVYKDYVFIGTNGTGISIIKNGKAKPLPLDKHKYLLYAHCFMPDGKGYCWISTNSGLFRADIEEMVNAYENDTPYVYYHYFGTKDGMKMTEMNGGCAPCAIELQDKTISFPTMEGLLWVNPQKTTTGFAWGGLFIDEIRVDGKKVNPHSLAKHALSAYSRDIQIKLAYPGWANAENMYIEYKLDDDSAWRSTDQVYESRIILSNLSHSSHILRIRKKIGFGADNYSQTDILFSISKLWYETWLFFVLIALLALGVFSLYLRFRTRQFLQRQRKLENLVAEKTKVLQEQNRELEKRDTIKTRLISIINHDMITPLRFLSIAGKNLLEKRKLINEDLQHETIREMTQTSGELQSLATNILNWIKYQNEGRGLERQTFNLNELIQKVLNTLQPAANQKGLKVIAHTEQDIEIYQFFEPLKILVHNILSNAINFSETGTITIEAVRSEDGEVTITITDEGIGMPSGHAQALMNGKPVNQPVHGGYGKGHGLGYLIIRDLIALTKTSLDIKTAPEKGTTVSISVPFNKSIYNNGQNNFG